MTTLRVASLIVLTAAISPAARAIDQQQPIFRTSVDAVAVDVLVLNGSQSIAGLGRDDFQLIDNGVPQAIGVVSLASVPVDVSLLLDVSASLRGERDALTADLAGIGGLLGSADRLQILAFGSEFRQILSLGTPPRPPESLPDLWQATSLYDALATTLMQPAHPDRRRLVVVLTDGIDTMSTVSVQTVLELARRSTSNVQIGLLKPNQPSSMAFQPWLPFSERNLDALIEVARVTGGTEHRFDQRSVTSRATAFGEILRHFRNAYVITFVPQGVERRGWHDLVVRVPGHPAATIRTRRGYNLDR